VEANPEHLAVLRGIHPRKVSVLNVAASDHAGTLALHIPTAVEGPSGLATVEHNPRWQTSRVEAVPVPAARLDEILANEVIGFIKVDVEGHELSALKGAEGILARHAPALLIEAEERHRQDAVASVSNFLAGFGYVGMMLVKGTLTSIDQFDPRTHQRIDDVQALDRGEVPEGYVNNFIFLGGR
jgi:FkbM family methyltransferase